MNKAELVEKMAKKSKLSKSACKQALEAFTESIGEAMKQGKSVVLTGFGTFTVAERKARTGAARMADLLRELGVPASRILAEGKSRNTRENAVYTAQLLQDKKVDKVLLCTSASHMPRAKACFERSGIQVVPVPAAYDYSFYKKVSTLDYLPQAWALENSTTICKEYLGIVYYWLRGWI